MPTAQSGARPDKYSVEKANFGGISLVTIHGIVNEAFEGRKLAAGVRAKKVVVNMRDVRRFASWGMSEWMDFLRDCSENDLYLVECPTYIASQLNIVTGLLGDAKLVSVYASYGCGSCGEEFETLYLVPGLREAPGETLACPACGGAARLDEYASFFDAIMQRPAYDIDDEVLAFLRSQFKYDLTRFRAFRRTQKDYTYLRLLGNVATLPAEVLARSSTTTTVVDLEGVTYEPGHVTGWRNYLAAALPKVKSLQLVNCPPGFLEAAVRPEDLRDKVKVRTFAAIYPCTQCGTQTAELVDVAAHLEELVLGMVPPVRCSVCRSTLVASQTPELSAIASSLPARDRDPVLDKFLLKSRALPVDKLENCIAQKSKASSGSRGRGRYVAMGLVVAAVGGAGAWMKLRSSDSGENNGVQPVARPHPTFTRPEWITSDMPASAVCDDMTNRLVCIGVSSYVAKKDDGVGEATNAALDELVTTIGLKITDPVFKDSVLPGYSNLRAKALSALETAELDRAHDPHAAANYAAATEVVRRARARVVDVLKAEAPAAVPAQRSDWYWEEYTRETGEGTEFLVYVRFDIAHDAVAALVDKFSASTSVLGSNVMTAFPGLAWQYAQFAGGAIVTKVGGALASAGVNRQQIVTAIGGQRIADATAFAKRADGATDDLQLTVETGDAAPQTVTVKH